MRLVLVCGGRTFAAYVVGKPTDVLMAERALMDKVLGDVWTETIQQRGEDIVIIQGGARGADNAAEVWARNMALPCVRHPAQWNLHGRAAGFVRNREMLRTWKPDLVVAFPGGKGTADMVKHAREQNVEVMEVS